MDLDLPGMSGIDAIFHIKTAIPKRSSVLTVYNDDEKVFKAIKAGAGGIFKKIF
jgi:DNA-binding NarL/FixJ family response regulator